MPRSLKSWRTCTPVAVSIFSSAPMPSRFGARPAS
jgi:hypothetical protein